MKILVTGGAGFIGSALIRYLLKDTSSEVINVDCLTYAGNLDSLSEVQKHESYTFEKVNICDESALEKLFISHKPDAVVHLAAESHVDRSIDGPDIFIKTNILGTFNLLQASLNFWNKLSLDKKSNFRFIHVSTDEVFGDLVGEDSLFVETSAYDPSSPYSASKASSDHLVRAWGRTYNLPTIVTNCSNNYGPFQFPEKLIPHVILKALRGEHLPLYGDGSQVRDWLYVEDHARALWAVLKDGRIGETYNIGGHNTKTNLEVVESICELLEEKSSNKPHGINNFSELITFVKDRPGHDMRYAIDASKIKNDISWTPNETFESGISMTVQWYLENSYWWERVLSGDYKLNRVGNNEQ